MSITRSSAEMQKSVPFGTHGAMYALHLIFCNKRAIITGFPVHPLSFYHTHCHKKADRKPAKAARPNIHVNILIGRREKLIHAMFSRLLPVFYPSSSRVLPVIVCYAGNDDAVVAQASVLQQLYSSFADAVQREFSSFSSGGQREFSSFADVTVYDDPTARNLFRFPSRSVCRFPSWFTGFLPGRFLVGFRCVSGGAWYALSASQGAAGIGLARKEELL